MSVTTIFLMMVSHYLCIDEKTKHFHIFSPQLYFFCYFLPHFGMSKTGRISYVARNDMEYRLSYHIRRR